MDVRDHAPRFDLDKVDFEWVEKTNNLKELKAAMRALIEDKGGYVELEKTLQAKIELLDPRAKKPDNKITVEEFKELENELSSWSKKVEKSEHQLKEDSTKEHVINESLSEKAKQAGNDYIRAKDFELALESYTRAIEFSPNNAAAYFNRALSYIKLKKFNKACLDCDKAIIIKPDYIKAFYRRALANMELKEFDKAIPDLTKVLEAEPENEQANKDLKKCRDELSTITGYRRINIIEADDEDDNEEEKVEEIKEKSPMRPLMADEYEAIKPSRVEELEILLENHNTEEYIKNIELLKSSGNKYYREEDFDSALTEFSKAIHSIEKNYNEESLLLNTPVLTLAVNLYNNRALCNSRLDLNNEAIRDSHKVLKLNKNNTKALYRIGKCEASRNNYREAARSMRKLLEIEPKNEAAKKDYDEYYSKAKELEDAEGAQITPRKKSIDNPPVFFEKEEQVLHRRVSFREEDLNESSRRSSKSENYKKAETLFPISRVKEDSDLSSEEEKLEIPISLPQAKKKEVVVIKNAKEIAEKYTGAIEPPKNSLMFEAAAKDLKHDKLQFYEYLKRIPTSEISVLFQKTEFSVELLLQCIDACETDPLDQDWCRSFFLTIPSTCRFTTTLKLLSKSEKSRLTSLFSILNSEELLQAFKLNL